MRRRQDNEMHRCGRASGRRKYAPAAARFERPEGATLPPPARPASESGRFGFDGYDDDSQFFDWIESGFDAEEFQEFLDAEPCGVEADPHFVERLRRELWWLILDRLLPGGKRQHH